MRLTSRCDAFAVYDDVLDDERWSEVWTWFQFEDLAPVTRTEGAWKLADGAPLAGPDAHTPNRDGAPLPDGAEAYPTDAPVDHVLEVLLERAGELSTWVGDDWRRIVGRPYVYPAGAGLSWHRDDHQLYSGAFVYYAHPEWNAAWGGALLVAEHDAPHDLPVMPWRFDNREFSEAVLSSGVGRYVLPRPNRLVVLGSQPHCVTPVAAAAGQHVRASVAGFFLRGERGA